MANDEQLSISIRYVDEGSPTEMFMGFYKCVLGVTGQAIVDDILSQLEKWQLQLQFLRGHAYDGAGAMAGKSIKVQLLVYPQNSLKHCTLTVLPQTKSVCGQILHYQRNQQYDAVS